uniref:RxLR effector candidate protein n=1 Tax=Hyaloperonospora arabidopsidis (strain Emoy2) TaxID=559515 RepID=M4BBT8_HYAAE
MRDAIANLQSLYQRHGRVFSDGRSEPSDVSRRTGGRDLQRQSLAGREAPSCRVKADSSQGNKITRSLPLHVTVVQDTPYVKALTTVRIHQWLWWGREYQLRIVCWSCRRRLVVSSNAYTICVMIRSREAGASLFGGVGETHPPLSIGRPIGVHVLPIGERAEASSLSRRSG